MKGFGSRSADFMHAGDMSLLGQSSLGLLAQCSVISSLLANTASKASVFSFRSHHLVPDMRDAFVIPRLGRLLGLRGANSQPEAVVEVKMFKISRSLIPSSTASFSP